jgi:hypothetical protein
MSACFPSIRLPSFFPFSVLVYPRGAEMGWGKGSGLTYTGRKNHIRVIKKRKERKWGRRKDQASHTLVEKKPS